MNSFAHLTWSEVNGHEQLMKLLIPAWNTTIMTPFFSSICQIVVLKVVTSLEDRCTSSFRGGTIFFYLQILAEGAGFDFRLLLLSGSGLSKNSELLSQMIQPSSPMDE